MLIIFWLSNVLSKGWKKCKTQTRIRTYRPGIKHLRLLMLVKKSWMQLHDYMYIQLRRLDVSWLITLSKYESRWLLKDLVYMQLFHPWIENTTMKVDQMENSFSVQPVFSYPNWYVMLQKLFQQKVEAAASTFSSVIPMLVYLSKSCLITCAAEVCVLSPWTVRIRPKSLQLSWRVFLGSQPDS